jgi:hypothetical protein
MRKLIPAITATFALAAAAQQPGQCVNPELVNGLVFLGRSEMKTNVTPGLPGFMKGFRAPTGFALIGTGVRGLGYTTVAYKTALASDKAHAALLAALGAEGWAVEATLGSSSTFNVADGPREGTVCRSGERLYLLVTEAAGVRYATVNAFPQQRPRDCNAPDPAMQILPLAALNAAPRFQFPAGTSLAQGAGGGGGDSGSYTMTSRIISAETAARLVEHLAGQVAGQGWQQESRWSGSRAAGSTWRKTGTGGFTWGTLEIVRVSEGTYDVDFTMAMMR